MILALSPTRARIMVRAVIVTRASRKVPSRARLVLALMASTARFPALARAAKHHLENELALYQMNGKASEMRTSPFVRLWGSYIHIGTLRGSNKKGVDWNFSRWFERQIYFLEQNCLYFLSFFYLEMCLYFCSYYLTHYFVHEQKIFLNSNFSLL